MNTYIHIMYIRIYTYIYIYICDTYHNTAIRWFTAKYCLDGWVGLRVLMCANVYTWFCTFVCVLTAHVCLADAGQGERVMDKSACHHFAGSTKPLRRNWIAYTQSFSLELRPHAHTNVIWCSGDIKKLTIDEPYLTAFSTHIWFTTCISKIWVLDNDCFQSLLDK